MANVILTGSNLNKKRVTREIKRVLRGKKKGSLAHVLVMKKTKNFHWGLALNKNDDILFSDGGELDLLTSIRGLKSMEFRGII